MKIPIKLFWGILFITGIAACNPNMYVLTSSQKGNCGNVDCRELFVQNTHGGKVMEVTIRQTEKTIINFGTAKAKDTTLVKTFTRALAPNSKSQMGCECSETSESDRETGEKITVRKENKFEVTEVKVKKK